MSVNSMDNLEQQYTKIMLDLRYIFASTYVFLLLEHLDSLPLEVEFIWKAPKNLAGICLLLYRYATLVGMTIAGPIISHFGHFITSAKVLTFCHQATTAMFTLCIVSLGIADGLVMLRVSVLWDRQRSIMVTILLVFLVTYLAAVICLVITTIKIAEHSTPNVCISGFRPHVSIGVWGPGVVFDSLVLSMTVFNTLATPRTQSTALTSALYNNGIAYFLILAGLRVTNLFLTIFSPYYIFAAGLAWAISAVTLSRFIFHLRCVEKRQSHYSDSFHDIDIDFTDPEAHSALHSVL